MCDKAILENVGTVSTFFTTRKIKEMCYKYVLIYPDALEYVPECYQAQRMFDKAVDTFPSTIEFVPECYKTQELCHRAVYRSFFVFGSIHDK